MSDDRAGLLVAQQLQGMVLPDTIVRCTEDPLLELANDELLGVQLLVVVDAAAADADHPPGTFTSFRWDAVTLRSTASGMDTHTFDVGESLQLAGVLGLLPNDVRLYVVFGVGFDRGWEVSQPVSAVVPRIALRIEHDVQEWLRLRSCTNLG
jgi:hydrogenase maturation protease